MVDGSVLGRAVPRPGAAPTRRPAYRTWFARARLRRCTSAKHVNEGEGDILLAGDLLLAGTGFRTAHAAHAEAQEVFGRPVITLQLVDPRFYHLDTALCVLDDDNVAYLPGGLLPGQPGGAAPALPGRGHRHRGRRRGARASTRSATAGTWCCRRRPPASPPRCASAATRPIGGRHVRAAQGRRRPEVLHAGGAGDDHRRQLRTPAAVADAERWTAHNYHPLPVVIADAEGAWVTDVDGRRYLDCLAGYSALNFGHRHPALIAAAHAQLDRLTLTSRAFLHDQFAAFCRRAGRAVRQGPGAADEHRRRGGGDRDQGGPQVGLPGQGRAGRPGQRSSSRTDNFHGRTTTIVSFSTDPDARDDFGPYTPGLPDRAVRRPRRAARRRSTTTTVAVLLEPIQGEAGRARAAGRLPAPASASCAPSATCCSSPTRSSPASAAPASTFAMRARGRRARHVRARQGARRRHRAGLGGGRATRDVLGVLQPGRARLDLRRQPAGLRGRHRGGRAAAHRRVPARARPSSASGCTPG